MAHPLRRPSRRAVRCQAPRSTRPGDRQPRPPTEGAAGEGPPAACRTRRDSARGQGRRPCYRADPGRPQGRGLSGRDRVASSLALVASAERIYRGRSSAPRGRRPARPDRERRPAGQDQRRVAPPRTRRPATPRSLSAPGPVPLTPGEPGRPAPSGRANRPRSVAAGWQCFASRYPVVLPSLVGGPSCGRTRTPTTVGRRSRVLGKRCLIATVSIGEYLLENGPGCHWCAVCDI